MFSIWGKRNFIQYFLSFCCFFEGNFITRMVLAIKANGKKIKNMVKVTENTFLFTFGVDHPFLFSFFFLFWGLFFDKDKPIYKGVWKNDQKHDEGDRKYFSCRFWGKEAFFFILFFLLRYILQRSFCLRRQMEKWWSTWSKWQKILFKNTWAFWFRCFFYTFYLLFSYHEGKKKRKIN